MRTEQVAKTCQGCGKTFYTRTETQRFHSEACKKDYYTSSYRLSARICARSECNTEFHPYRPNQIYCTSWCKNTDYNQKHDIAGKLRRRREQTKKEAKERTS